MIVHASALLAIVLDEPDAARYARAIASDQQPRIPSVTWFEASMRIEAAADAVAISRFEDFPRDFGIEIISFTPATPKPLGLAAGSTDARNIQPALISGDCLVYGVAKAERETLLFKGNDFAQTDIEPALKD